MKTSDYAKYVKDPVALANSSPATIDCGDTDNGGDIEWAEHNDVWTLTHDAGTWNSGSIIVTTTVKNSRGVSATPVVTTTVYNTNGPTTLADVATALALLDNVKSCTYSSQNKVLTLTMNPGYTVTAVKSGTLVGNMVFTPAYTGGVFVVKKKLLNHVAFGAISLVNSAALMVHCVDDVDSESLEQWRSLPIATNSLNKGLTFNKILKTGSTASLFTTGNLILLL